MMYCLLNQKSSTFFRPLTRTVRYRTCGTVDEPPCPPQKPPTGKDNCEFGDKKDDGKPGRCTHDIKKYYNACGQEVPERAGRRPNEPLFNRLECCYSACPELVPRLDDMYYKTSDKGTRCYRQTWVECPSPVKRTRTYCAFDKVSYPPMEIRAKISRPQTACKMDKSNSCGPADNKNPKCTRLVLPGCRSRRGTFHCLYDQNPKPYCPTRRCPPYPSFSECVRKRPGPPKSIECKCLTMPNTCEVWAEIEKAVRTGKMKKLIK